MHLKTALLSAASSQDLHQMIPRTKVNYGYSDLFRSVWIGYRSTENLKRLVDLVQKFMGQQHVRLTPSGRGGFHAILQSIDRPRVIVPSYTCKAVIEAAKLANKKIDYVEAEPDGFNIRPEDLHGKLGPDAAMIATHQFGIPCAIEHICELCKLSGTMLIEDCAASLGTRINGRLAGTFGDAAFFSFDSTKLITVPLKGGFITTPHAELMKKIDRFCSVHWKPLPLIKKINWLLQATILRSLENPFLYRLFHNVMFKWRRRYTADTPDLNLRLTPYYQYEMADWQAFFAADQLSNLDKIVTQRRDLYNQFHRELSDCKHLRLPPEDKLKEWCCIRFPIRVPGDKLAFYRRAAEMGVDFAFSFTFIDCPKTHKHAIQLADSVLDIPYYWKLTESERKNVIQVLKTLDAEISHENQWTQGHARQSNESGESLQ